MHGAFGGCAEPFHHDPTHIGDPRYLTNEGAVGVGQTQASGCNKVRHASEDAQTVRSGPPLVTVRKVSAEVTERSRAEHGVREGVRNYVGVAVTLEFWLLLETDPSEHE